MAGVIPQSFRKVVCQKLTNNFSEAVTIVNADIPKVSSTEVLVRNRFLGVNASDINFTAGHYMPDVKPPFDTGFEAVGDVVEIGGDVKHLKVGQPVLYSQFGAFSEFKNVDAATAIPLPAMKPEYLPFLVSGMTATISLDKVGEIKAGETVLVTAAAGGTGQFAVQWAKMKGCKVLGTCSTDEKVEFLKKLGCDRPINYKKEDLGKVLQEECPNGLDVVYECVGGKTFEACLKNLGPGGRLVIIGMVETYQGEGITQGGSAELLASVPIRLLKNSSSLRGFFLPQFRHHFKEYMTQMIGAFETGKLLSQVDNGASTGKPFKSGVDDVVRAVEYLFSGKNIGKIVVEVPHPAATKL